MWYLIKSRTAYCHVSHNMMSLRRTLPQLSWFYCPIIFILYLIHPYHLIKSNHIAPCHVLSLSFNTINPFFYIIIFPFYSFSSLITLLSIHYSSFLIPSLLSSSFLFIPSLLSFFPSILPFLISLSFLYSFILFLLFFLHHFPLQLLCNNTSSFFCKAVELFTSLLFDTIKQLI